MQSCNKHLTASQQLTQASWGAAERSAQPWLRTTWTGRRGRPPRGRVGVSDALRARTWISFLLFAHPPLLSPGRGCGLLRAWLGGAASSAVSLGAFVPEQTADSAPAICALFMPSCFSGVNSARPYGHTACPGSSAHGILRKRTPAWIVPSPQGIFCGGACVS